MSPRLGENLPSNLANLALPLSLNLIEAVSVDQDLTRIREAVAGVVLTRVVDSIAAEDLMINH